MIKLLLSSVLFLLLSLPTLADGYKVEPAPTFTDAKVAEAIRKSLDEKGQRVLDENGKTICEIWWRKEIPTSKEEVTGAVFGQLGEGTLVGVVNFPANVSDYRGQGIKAGVYTLRYGLILQDGNHLGVSASRDFLLLCPVTEDKDPNVRLKFDELLKLSRAVSGTGHPSVWSLVQPESDKDFPKVSKNEHEQVILQTKLATRSGPLSVGLIVIGRTEG